MGSDRPEDQGDLRSFDHDKLVGMVERLLGEVQALRERVADLEAENSDLRDENERLRGENEKLRAENSDLRRRLDLDSTNSGMPPSTDDKAAREKRKRKRVTKNPGGAKRGKKPGATGHTLQRVDNPDITVVHRPGSCVGCGSALDDAVTTGTKRRQVFDLPPQIRAVVTEHVVETCRCICGRETEGNFPAEARSPACWGRGVRALAVYLIVAQHIPYNRTAEILFEVFDIKISEGTLVNIVVETAMALVTFETTVKAMLMAAGVVHFDETGARVHDGADTHHVHVACTVLLTLLKVHKNRGRVAMNEIGILPDYTGIACHDGYARYWDYHDCDHAKCGAHIVRNLQAIGEVDRHGGWANGLADLLLEANVAAHQARDNEQSVIDASLVHSIKTRYGRYIVAGYKATPEPGDGRKRTDEDKDAHNLVKRLDTKRGDVLRYVDDITVPFTNNEAERDLRPTKLHQKVSGLWRTLAQAENWCRIRSYVSTLRKNHQPVLAQLRAAIGGTAWTPTQSWIPGT